MTYFYQSQYACRKTLADSRPRVRGRFAKNDDFGETLRSSVCSSSHHEEDEKDDVSSYLHNPSSYLYTDIISLPFCLCPGWCERRGWYLGYLRHLCTYQWCEFLQMQLPHDSILDLIVSSNLFNHQTCKFCSLTQFERCHSGFWYYK